MNELISVWKKGRDYFDLTAALTQGRITLINGLPLLPRAALAAALFQDMPRPLLFLTAEEEEAVTLTENLQQLLGDTVCHFPALELLPFEVYAHNIELVSARIGALSRLIHGEKLLIVTSVSAATRRLAPAEVFRAHHLLLKGGGVYPPEELAHKLQDMGYERAALTDIPGAFSLRGSIVDVFPITGKRPLRIEFFDDEIDSIRYFDPACQLSEEETADVTLPPARELPLNGAARERAREKLGEEYDATYQALHGPAKKELLKTYRPLIEYLGEGVWDNGMEALSGHFYEQTGSIFDYLGAGLVLISEPEAVKKTSIAMKEERGLRYFDLLDSGRLLPSFYHNFLEYEELHAAFAHLPLLLFCQLGMRTGGLVPEQEHHYLARELPPYAHNPAAFCDDMRRFTREAFRVIISASSDLRLQRVEEILQENGLPPVVLVKAGFTQGFESKQLKLALVTEQELFSKQSKKRHRRVFSGGEKIAHFLDLKSGDYVVHVHQGIGRYEGVRRLAVGEVERDYLLIQYAGEDKLYLPVDQLDLIQKYIGSESGAPKLYKLGGGDWGRVKARVRAAVAEMADDLLKLYAAREKIKGFAFSADSAWQREFEDAFPYVETPDQLASLEDIKSDMESERVMDRLLCGDVGYGKTEIALRAAFKAVMDGKQVAILVPTTVLAQQHYRTLRERCGNFSVNSGSLSRFASVKEQKEVLKGIGNGSIDVVVGTHRLLSADVRFKDLGLLIVDEEQRFGVAHKEKIKALKSQVDVLTLSATPIPRTLHMALVGMRDMSVITTPPEDRHPVQTYVVEYHERLVRDAIARELSRGGQVYFVHNRVYNIFEVAEDLRRQLPEARILVAHGQMSNNELEKVMLEFVAREGDVLVCTTIIESGLDIPNVNTLIVDEADMFGLAQLYQLRGRVGRSERQAFAYFTYRRDRIINDIATKRLIAIRDFTELGAGFKIAMRDLELRGAGNILGPEQHGHIASVGFDLYCKLLDEEMQRSRGGEAPLPQVSTLLELELNAFIPNSVVDDSALKVEIYKRLAAAESDADIDELTFELQDRYGKLPPAMNHLLLLGRVKILGRKLRITSISQKTGLIEVKFAEQHPVSGENLLALLTRWEKRLVFSDKKGFAIKISTADVPDNVARVDMLLRVLGELMENVRVATVAAKNIGNTDIKKS